MAGGGGGGAAAPAGGGRFGAPPPHLLDLARYLLAVGLVLRDDLGQVLQHRLGRDVGAAGHQLPVCGQEGGSGPAAQVVTGVDVRALVVVHAHGHEVLVDVGDDAGVGVGRLVHDVAPVAPDGGEGKQGRPG